MKTELTNLLTIAVKKASHNVVRDFNEISFLVNNSEAAMNFAKNANIKAQETMFGDLKKIKPKYSFIFNSLEPVNNKDQSNFFVINGILGIENFYRGIPLFCLALSLERDTTTFASVVFNPVTNELFYAEKDNGAFYNSKKIRKIDQMQIKSRYHNIVATDLEYIKNTSELQGRAYISNCKTLDLCYLAAAKVNKCCYQEPSVASDLSPAILIAKEAGYNITMNIKNEPKKKIITQLVNKNP